MKKPVLVALAALLLLISGEVLAEKLLVHVTSENLKADGFAVETAKGDDGMVQVVVTRDLSMARTFDANSDIQLVRNATLEVRGAAGLIVRCQLEAESGKGTVIYRFAMAPEQIAHSSLTISEIDDYKESEHREHLIGGGTIYELRLADVVKQ